MVFFGKFISNQRGSHYLSASLLIALAAVPFVAVEQNVTQTLEAAIDDRMSATTVGYEAIEFNNDSSTESGCGCLIMDTMTTFAGSTIACIEGWSCCPFPDSNGNCHLIDARNWALENCASGLGPLTAFCRTSAMVE